MIVTTKYLVVHYDKGNYYDITLLDGRKTIPDNMQKFNANIFKVELDEDGRIEVKKEGIFSPATYEFPEEQS
jgi:hypothetical protein